MKAVASATKKKASTISTKVGASKPAVKRFPAVAAIKQSKIAVHGHIRFSPSNFAVPDEIYRASDLERHEIITRGVPACYVVVIAKRTGIPRERLFSSLGFPRSTIEKKIKANEVLGTDQSEKIVGFERIVGQVKAMVAESGNPEGFDAERWVGEWLEKPQRALDGRKPAELMNTVQGQQIVSGLLAKAQSGAYA